NIAVLANRSVIAWSSAAHPYLETNNTITGEPITDEQEAWLGSCIYLVAAATSPLYSYINQNIGRKAAGYLTVLPLAIGWLLIAYAQSVTYLFAGRIIQGFSFGGVNVFQSMYISEMSEDSIRGALGAMRGISTELGSLTMYIIGPFLGITETALVSLVFPLAFLFLFFWLPESPMFLLGKGRSQKALDAYIWFRRGDTENAHEEFRKLDVVIQAQPEKMTIRQIMSSQDTRNAMVIALVLNVVMRLCGYLVVFGYISKLFEISGSSISRDADPMIVGFLTLCATIVATFVTDTLGRRMLLLITLITQSFALGILGIFIYLKDLGFDLSGLGVIPLICLSVFCICVIPGIGSTTFIVISEIFRPEARGIATAVSCSFSWILAYISTQYHHNLEDVLGLYGCYWVYGTVSLLGALYIYLKVPETKNRSLESILEELNGNVPIRRKSIFKFKGRKSKQSKHDEFEMENVVEPVSITPLSQK
ncbi:hypothetical protein L9F63_012998, partial [Diploptera punctata]